MDGTGPTGAQVALLVDGDNVSARHAGRMILGAAHYGRVTVKRVYLAPAHLPGWAAAEGFRLVQSGPQKSATDLLLCIEAVDLACRNPGMAFAIASSDRDFSALALYLIEKGHAVLGLGEAKAPGHFRKSCQRFEVLEIAAEPAKPTPVQQPAVTMSETDLGVAQLVFDYGEQGVITLHKLGSKVGKQVVKVASLPGGTLRAYLDSRPDLYHLDPKGPDAKVRLVKSVSVALTAPRSRPMPPPVTGAATPPPA